MEKTLLLTCLVLLLNLGVVCTAFASDPPYPQGYYPSRAAAEAACEGDKPWNKAYIEGPYTRVIDQICFEEPESPVNMNIRSGGIRAYLYMGPNPEGQYWYSTIDNLTFYWSNVFDCNDPNIPGGASCVPYNPPKALGCGCSQSGNKLSVGNPVNIATGNKFEEQTDYSVGGLSFVRYYNSDPDVRSAYMGIAWLNTYDRTISWYLDDSAPTSVTVQRPDGQELNYTKLNGVWIGDPDVPDILIENDNSDGSIASWQLYVASTHQYENYSATGKLLSISDGSRVIDTITYTDGSQLSSGGVALQPGLLWKVTGANGRALIFGYDDQYRIVSVTLPDGDKITYSYNASNYLSSVTYPGQVTRQYLYDEPAYSAAGANKGKLTGIIDGNNNRFATFSYQADGRATSTQHANGADLTSISYSTDGTSATVTYPLGQQSTATFVESFGSPHIIAMSAPCGVACGQRFRDETLDSNGYPKSTTDFDNVTTSYTYDAAGLETQRIEAQSTPVQRTINTTWDTVFRNPLERTVLDASGALTAKTGWVYNTRGQVLARCEDDPTVAGATSYVCSNTGTPPAGVRRWVYTYCDSVGGQCPLIGLLLSVDGPRTDVSDVMRYSYYQTADESGCGSPGGACHRAGDLWKVTDALGHVTTTASYDKDGRPTETIDPNGVVTTFTYTPRGWLRTRTVAGATTTVDYDAVGDVTEVRQPDGVYTAYRYDAAHRLIKIIDALGNHINYTLDAAGNRTAENTYAKGSSSPARALSRQYNTLGQLVKSLDAYGRITSYTYDADGNRTDSTDPFNVTTHSSYDALSRLAQTIRNYQGTDSSANTTTSYTYDSQDNVSQVTDPDGLITHYYHNGLDDLNQLLSPDTGTTTYTYDAAGNRITKTDSRGVVSTYTYDAINRLTGISYPTPGLDVHYYYDQTNTATGCSSSYPIGRLTRMIDASGSTTWCYDEHGNVIKKTQVVGTTTYTTTYAYNSADRLMGVTYPDGASVTYTRDADGRIASVAATPIGSIDTAVVSTIKYLPFGPADVFTFAQGNQKLTRLFNSNYWPTVVSSNALYLAQGPDALGRPMWLKTAANQTPPIERYVYDPLSRLEKVTDPNNTPWQSYSYDKTGDRLVKATVGIVPGDTYHYQSGTHRLIDITGPDASGRSMDANGNTTAFQANGWTYRLSYNDANRLTSVQQNGATIMNYLLNGKGERVRKAPVGGDAIDFVYNRSGRLLGEYTGQTKRDYVWAGGTLVAILDYPAQGGDIIHYVHTDMLGTPRAVTTQAGQLVWDWPSTKNPFGERPASGNGYTLNLRFPGQYHDTMTGLNYNYFRDYEPATGRYIQSDPLGLNAGVSTYAYVQGNPIVGADRYGLASCPSGHWVQVGSIMANVDFLGGPGTLIKNLICRCVWLWVTTQGPYMWSGNPTDPTLPRTTGTPVGMTSATSCMCEPPPPKD